MKECFDNLVGLKGVCGANHDFYVNGLPGITFSTFAKTANEEYNTAAKMYTELYKEAVNDVISDVLSQTEGFSFNDVSEVKTIGTIGTNFIEIPEKLIVRRIKTVSSDPYISARLKMIEFYSDRNATAKLYIDGEEQKIDVKKGYNLIPVNDVVGEVAIDITCFNLGYNTMSCDCGCNYECNECVNVDKWAGPDYTSLDTTGKEGLRLTFACACDVYRFLCPYADIMKHAIRLKIGIKLMLEAIASTSISRLVRVTKEQADFWLARWEGTPNRETGFSQRSEYWSEIKKIAGQVKMSKSACNTCTGIQIKTVRL